MLNSRPHPTRPLIKYGTLLLGALLAGCNSSSSLDPTPTQKQITIKRDKFGTPHVYANDTYGLLRLWIFGSDRSIIPDGNVETYRTRYSCRGARPRLSSI